MANFFQTIATELGLSSKSAQPTSASPPSGSQNLAFSLTISNQGVFTSENIYVSGTGNSTVVVSKDGHNVIVGGTGNDHLTGGSGPDVILGGAGTNVLSGGGGTDVFGHAVGATDYITDFSAAAGEKIALEAGLSFQTSHNVTVDPASIGLPAGPAEAGVQLTFSDASTVTLLNSAAHPDPSWFL